MTLLVGCSCYHDNRATLEYSAALARSASQDLLLVSVIPAPWPTPVAGHTDREYEAWSQETGRRSVDEALALAREVCPDVKVQATAVPGRSVPATLTEQAQAAEAVMIVIGSGQDGPYGHVHLSSTADRLLHSSPVPIAVATRGYRAASSGRISRATCAFRGDAVSQRTLERTAQLCVEVGASLRVATFAVRGRTMYPPEVGLEAEDLVLRGWVEQSHTAQALALAQLSEAGELPADTDAVVTSGRSWAEALDNLAWERDEVLVVGSSPAGLLERVFLGSSGTKILRHSPVPVVVVR